MVLIDFSQMMIATYLQKGGNVDLELFRHKALTKLKMYKNMFGDEYGDLVICCDSTKYWRTDKFKYYKQKRKDARKKSSIDWNDLWDKLNIIKQEIKTYLPYIMLEIPKAEADDIIGTLCIEYGDIEKILIISGDKDFPQLQKHRLVQQFDPQTKLFRTTDDPEMFLKEHIISGDKGDGVPNVLSDDDAFVNENKKQSRLMTAKVQQWLTLEPKQFLTKEQLKNWKRNEGLVSLFKIPKNISDSVLKEFKTSDVGDTSRLLEYFEQFELTQLIKKIEEF